MGRFDSVFGSSNMSQYRLTDWRAVDNYGTTSSNIGFETKNVLA